MKTGNSHILTDHRPSIVSILAILCFAIVFSGPAAAQVAGDAGASAGLHYRVGERLTYSVSFGKFSNAAYAETSVVSQGKLSGIDAVELRLKIKTLGVVSAAFLQLDESRTVFASPETGLPLYIDRLVNDGPLPKDIIGNYLKEPTSSFDLLTLIYKARQSNGTGTFPLFENDQLYTVTVSPSVSEKVQTEAGIFDTVVSTVQGDYLAAKGIKELKINFVTDENRVPALIRVKTAKGDFRASLLAVQIPKAVVDPTPAPTPAQSKSPVAVETPRPKPTATPYIDDQPISPELGFSVGETLDFNVSEGGKPIATITLAAKERRLFQKEDSLLLTATVTGTEPANTTFALGDSIQAQVDPETLAPRWVELKFNGELKSLNQVVTFDNRNGNVAFGDGKKVDSPIGTHTLLSLIFAMRSFNLKPSKDPNNPVNDTRVAVFWESQPYVFTLRPSNFEEITVSGEKVLAQMITVNTGNEKLDKRAPKVWIAANGRVPVHFSFGTYQADLVAPSKNLPK